MTHELKTEEEEEQEKEEEEQEDKERELSVAQDWRQTKFFSNFSFLQNFFFFHSQLY